MEEHQAVFGQVHDRSSALEFYSVRKYDKPQPDNELVVILRNKLTNGWDAIVLTVEKETAASDRGNSVHAGAAACRFAACKGDER